jgi:long-chain acyl-CoA synthetase
MLSHHNLASNAASLADSFDPDDDEVRLCVLPLSHIYARTCDLYTWVYRGTRLILAEHRETLARDLQLARPTALNAVPYIYQKIADRIRSAGGDEAAAVRNFFGGRIEVLNCGGAPLAPEVESWFATRGQPVLMGYGLTETSPVIAASTPSAHRAGAVGRLLPNVEAVIANDGELLTRGPNLMLGYWRDEAATAAAIRDGWFHTGDLAALDADGFLSIHGRKKELIVLSTGKKVAPSRVELLLTASPLIEQAAVFGDGHCGLLALIVPSTTAPLACGLARPQTDDERHATYTAEITRCLAPAAREEQIHAFALLDRPFSIERGELTAKLSLCRSVIAQNFAADLKRLISQPLQVETAPAKSLESAR